MFKLTLPFRAHRVFAVIEAAKNGRRNRKEIIKILQQKGSFNEPAWYVRKAETYVYYCIYWGLVTIENEKCKLTPLGEAVFSFYDAKKLETATELIYYGFATSDSFATLKALVEMLFSRLEESGPFVITSSDVASYPEFEERRDVSDLLNVFHRARILERKGKRGQLEYVIKYQRPTLPSFVISLFHFVHNTQLAPPYSTKYDALAAFRRTWFLARDDLVTLLRRCRAQGWISYQEFADINQFEFLVENLAELVQKVLKI